ncbi:MAG: PilZ domain-containing protein [Candidatus Accumulibacter sp.]|nr:PilZ domain-containing protein [Accumulibacter sp.]
MREQRRHQRVRFNAQPLVRFGQAGHSGAGRLENLSLGGLMVCTELPLKVGSAFGCDFSVLGSVLIDISAIVVGCVGKLYSARFQAGPVSEQLLKDEIELALSSGKGSVLSVNELQGRRVMRVAGGLNGSLRDDFMHSLTKVGVDEIDLSKVTDIDNTGAELCRIAAQTNRIAIVRPACRVSDELAAIAGWPPV